MEAPTWLKPAATGAVVGAIATMVLGFSQGGWYLGSSADSMAESRSAAAVIEALVPICISQARLDPQATTKLEELVAMTSSYARRDFVMEAGWATVPAAESPSRNLAAACAEALAEAPKA